MGEFTDRAYLDDDAEALAALLNRIEEHAGGQPYLTAEEIRELAPVVLADPSSDSRMVFDGDGALIGAAWATTPPEGGFRADLFGGVDPAWRRRGFGRDLLDWQLGRTAELHDAAAPEREWELHLTASMDDADALRLYQRLDLTPIRYWFEMLARTGEVPDAKAPDGVDIVDYPPGCEIELYRAHQEAFADHWGFQARGEDNWLALTVRSKMFLPKLSRLAVEGEAIAGYVLTYRSPVSGRGYIGQVGVRRPWRQRGLAGAMLAEVLRACAAAGFDSATLNVDAQNPTGAVGVYERVGFAVESRYVTYARVLPARSPAGHRPS